MIGALLAIGCWAFLFACLIAAELDGLRKDKRAAERARRRAHLSDRIWWGDDQ